MRARGLQVSCRPRALTRCYREPLQPSSSVEPGLYHPLGSRSPISWPRLPRRAGLRPYTFRNFPHSNSCELMHHYSRNASRRAVRPRPRATAPRFPSRAGDCGPVSSRKDRGRNRLRTVFGRGERILSAPLCFRLFSLLRAPPSRRDHSSHPGRRIRSGHLTQSLGRPTSSGRL